MKFAEAKPLGERGLWWLKVHLANLYGYDKGTFEERVEFVHEHLDDIFDSAENPLNVKLFHASLMSALAYLFHSPRAEVGGRRPMIPGNVWQRVWN